MRLSELQGWLQTAQQHQATTLQVRRARRNGSTPKHELFFESELALVDVEALGKRMREDMLVRRLVSATFELTALKGKESLMLERLQVLRDESIENADDVTREADLALPRAVQAALDHSSKAHQLVREMARENSQELRAVIGDLSTRLIEHESKVTETLMSAFEMATMRRESEKEENASQERRELAKVALTELAPIAGMLMSKLSGNAMPALTAFFKSFDDSQLEKLATILKPEQLAVLSQLSEMATSDGEKKRAANGKPVTQ